MSAPIPFSNFGKSNLFQIYDKDPLESQVKVLVPTAQVKLEPVVVFASGAAPRGSVKANFVCPVTGSDAEAVFQSDASKASTLAVKRKNLLKARLPGVNGSLTLSTSEKDFSGVKPKFGFFTTTAVDYSRANLTASFSSVCDMNENQNAALAASVGANGLAVGGDVKFVKAGAGKKYEAKSYNAGVAYTRGDYTVALTSDAKFEKIKAVLLANKVGPKTAPVNVGVQAKAAVNNVKAAEVIVAVERAVTAQTTVRAALVATTGQLVATVDHKLPSPNASLAATVSTQLPTSGFAPLTANKFGVSVTVGAF